MEPSDVLSGKKVIFGNTAFIPPNTPIAFSLEHEVKGTIHENYGVETHTLSVTFFAGNSLKIRQAIVLAVGTDGYGGNRPFREKLFRQLHARGISESIKRTISGYIFEMYQAGEVKEKELISKIEEIFQYQKLVRVGIYDDCDCRKNKP